MPSHFWRGGRCAIELFSGRGNLSTTMAACGLRVGPRIELQSEPSYDLLRSNLQSALLCLLREGKIWFAEIGTPCTIWSVARKGIRNVALAHRKELRGVELALFTKALCKECVRCHVRFSVENQISSRLWVLRKVFSTLTLAQRSFPRV